MSVLVVSVVVVVEPPLAPMLLLPLPVLLLPVVVSELELPDAVLGVLGLLLPAAVLGVLLPPTPAAGLLLPGVPLSPIGVD